MPANRRPEAEHLLLAALDLLDGTIRGAFERVGADPSTFRQAIEERHVQALRAVGTTDGGRRQRRAAREGRLSQQRVGTERFPGGPEARPRDPIQARRAHVLLAIADTEHGTAIRAVRSLVIDVDPLAAAAREEADHEVAPAGHEL